MKAKTKDGKSVVLELDDRDGAMMEAAARQSALADFKIRKILVPIDFSECSKKALRYAVPLAKQHQATLSLLYVVPANYAAWEAGMVDFAAIEGNMRQEAKNGLETLILQEVHGLVPTERHIRAGGPASEIVDLAREQAADLIVISTHGRTGLSHVLIGSVAEHVVQRAPCPVLVVREDERDFVTKR